MKKSRSQIACPDSGSGFILGESDKSSIFLKTGLLFLRAGPAWDLSEAAVRRSWCFRPNCYLSFSAIYCFSVIFFSTPRGYVRTKNSFTLSIQNPSFRWRREWDSNPRGRDAQRLSCQSTNIQVGSRGRRFNHSAIPAQPATKTGTSLKPFPEARRIVRSTRVRRQDTLDEGQSTLKARILPLNPPRENVIHHNPLP